MTKARDKNYAVCVNRIPAAAAQKIRGGCAKKNRRLAPLFSAAVFAALVFPPVSCARRGASGRLEAVELFSLSYGNFDDELGMSGIAGVGEIHTHIAMQGGFFYIANGEGKKIMELNSYGDLLTLFRNDGGDSSPNAAPASGGSTRVSVSYPFNNLSAIAVDSQKRIYVASEMPAERRERDASTSLLYSYVVLRFLSDGSSEDYIGRQGVGGSPFPFVKNIYATAGDELVVVCVTAEGLAAYWFSEDGSLLYEVPLLAKDAPALPDAPTEVIAVLQDAVPDRAARRLFVKIDYYEPRLDSDTRMESGIDYARTLVFPLALESGRYESAVTIPPYEETVSTGYSQLVFRLPYDFLGVSDAGGLFFILATADGFAVEMVRPQSQRAVRRHFDVNRGEVLYSSFSLSSDGIISALLVGEENARVVWWRTDLLDAATGSQD